MSSFDIPFVQLYSKEKADLVEGIFAEFKQVIEKSQFILGEKVEQFERSFAEVAGTRFAVAVNSGLDALLLSLRALGIKSGDEVITAPNSFLATAAAISLVGAKPVFVDVDWDFNLNPELLERAITPKTSAILPVHLTGYPAKMDRICSLASAKGLLVIEDAAQSVGAKFGGKSVGSFGNVGCFSLHPLKNLHVWGDGGMVTTNSLSLSQNLRLQRNHGLINRDESEFFSYNSRLDTLQAVVGLAFLELLPETSKRRRANALTYVERLSGLQDRVRLPSLGNEEVSPVFHVFQIWTERRHELKSFLAEKGIETKIHYPIPIHLQKAAQDLGYKRGDFPITEKLSEGILSLPVRENLEDLEVHRICDAISEFFSH